MKQKENEINACNASIEIIQRIKGVKYYPDKWPEKENRNTPDIELILAPKDNKGLLPKIAVEHTIIEAHDKQIAYVNQSYDIARKINQKCQKKLPTNRWFQIAIPPALVTNTTQKSRNQFIEEISNHIPDIAKTLVVDDQWSSVQYNGHEVLLICCGSYPERNGTIGRISTSPKELDKERRDRFRRAVEEKLPKLIQYKIKGFATALLLEDVSYSHARPKDNWKDLIPDRYHSEFQLEIDWVVIFVSYEKK